MRNIRKHSSARRSAAKMGAVVLALFVFGVALAMSQSDIRGKWHGFAQTTNAPVGASLDVPYQFLGLHAATFTIAFIPPTPCNFVGFGAAQQNGTYFGFGIDPIEGIAVWQGRQKSIGDIRFSGMTFAVFSYQGAPLYSGTSAITQLKGGRNWQLPGPPDVQGPWVGEIENVYLSPGAAQLSFLQTMGQTNQPTSAVYGAGTVFVPPTPCNLNGFGGSVAFLGTVGPQGPSTAPFGGVLSSVEPSQNNLLGILFGSFRPGSLGSPAMFSGSYRFYPNVAELASDVIGGDWTPDVRRFELVPGQ